MNTTTQSKTEIREEWLASAQNKLNSLIQSRIATSIELNNAEYAVALHINILNDMDGMSN